MLMAYRIDTFGAFAACVTLSAFATLNLASASEDPSSNQATISTDSKISSFIPVFGMDVAATIDSVDGRSIGAGTHKIPIDAGIHTISLTCRAIGPTNTEEVELDVVAGAHYQTSVVVGGRRAVPCTSLIYRKLDSGKSELVPVTYKVDADGMYQIKPEGMAVWAPKDCIADVAIYGRDRSVDFVANQEDWIASGQYTLKLTKIPKSVTNDISFIKKIGPDAKDYVEDRPRDKLNLVVKEAGRFDVNGQVGYRVVAVSEGRMAFIVTYVLQKSWITIASLTYPLRPGVAATDAIPRSCYDKFVESVKQIQ
jgi:hypothetical protein